MKTVKTILLVSLSLTMLLLFFPRVFSQNSSVLIISYFDEQNQITNTIEGNIYGSKVSFSNELSSEEGYSFAFWIVNGVVRTDLPLDYEFLVTYDTELIGVFRLTTSMLLYSWIQMEGCWISNTFSFSVGVRTRD